MPKLIEKHRMRRNVASEFTEATSDEHYDRICANLEYLGFEYWTTRDCVTMYQHPSGAISEIVYW